MNTQRAVAVEVGLRDRTALFQRDLVIERGAQTVADAAFHLCGDDVGVHGHATVHRAPDLVHLRAAVFVARNFHDLGDIAAERLVHGHAAGTIGGRRFEPAGQVGHGLEHAGMARMFAEHGEPAFDGVLLDEFEQFIDEGFCRVRGMRMADRAPPENRYARFAVV